MSKNVIQIHGLPGRACAFEVIAELLQGHPLHQLVHGSDRSRWTRASAD